MGIIVEKITARILVTALLLAAMVFGSIGNSPVYAGNNHPVQTAWTTAMSQALNQVIQRVNQLDEISGGISSGQPSTFSANLDRQIKALNITNRTEAFMANGGMNYGSGEFMKQAEQLAKEAPANVSRTVKTIDAADIQNLQITADKSALVVEPYSGNQIEIAQVGVSNPDQFKLDTQVSSGVLSVSWTGEKADMLYINTSSEKRINTLVVRIPAGMKLNYKIEQGSGIVQILAPEGPVTGNAQNGSILVEHTEISYPVNLTAANGSVFALAEKISADVKLTAKNGSCYAGAERVTGKLDAQAQNGSVKSYVEYIKDGNFQVANGSVFFTTSEISGDVSVKCTNGKMNVELLKKPVNLTFHITGKEKAIPSDWYDGIKFGSGIPTLTIDTLSNANVDFTVPK